ncbi:MAG: hypothetical protein JWN04_70 [Myxococcaceae bacterium]|nr:hypothetical protein [Myxococcaceae bacterium]
MNVKVEGENVVRNLDMTTHNHASVPGNMGPWPFLSSMSIGAPRQPAGPCKDDAERKDSACGAGASKADRCGSPGCREAMRCELQPYRRTKSKRGGCCPGQTPHHLVEVHCFTQPGGRGSKTRMPGFDRYSDAKAPCLCCDESSRAKGDHGSMHALQGVAEWSCMDQRGLVRSWGARTGSGTMPLQRRRALPRTERLSRAAAAMRSASRRSSTPTTIRQA